MADSRRHAISSRLDIEQLVLEAQQRWLRPAEICEILQNHRKFQISPEPPHLPASGSLFLFDKKVLRYFRKDGHNWRKKKDGKTIREAHEKLKAGSIDVLHCYYAHGEDNENFQRRIYWLLEEDLSHIVLVHYREVKVNRGYFNQSQVAEGASPNIQDFQGDNQNFGTENSASVSFESFDHHRCTVLPEKNEMTCLESAQAPEVIDVESGGLTCDNHKQLDWGDTFESLTFGGEFAPSIHPSVLTSESNSTKIIATQGSELLGKPLRDGFPQSGAHQTQNLMHAQPQDLEEQLFNSQCREDVMSYKQTNLSIDSNDFSTTKHLMHNSSEDEVLKKNDSFGRWMSKELEDVSESSAASSALCWQTLDSESQFEDDSISSQYMLGPSLSEDQLFSIVDVSPNWVYAGSQTKVLITGKFLKCLQDVENVKWSCMFGELEVPVDVIADGVLRCLTPQLGAGRVSFCITCSNRVACSEVREFEYRDRLPQRKTEADEDYDIRNDILNVRFDRMLSLGQQVPNVDYSDEICCLQSKINSLISEDDSDDDRAETLSVISEESFSVGEVKDRLAERMLKEKLYSWLLHKASEGGKGSSVLDEDGQGVLHFAAALGYNWAFSPTIEAGVNINFRDIRGWTALHWAAFCGRERTVAYLVSLGAAPGALTDPNPKYPMGRTAADLASSRGHKGIAGYLAESALGVHLSSLNLKEGPKPVQVALERAATQSSDGDHPSRLSLKDSLTAVCNATQAAARIHQVFRVQSFQRKQIEEYRDIVGGISDEDALSMLALKTHKSDRFDEPVQAAAIRIQNKFRSWKGRKEFLMIRQHIVKIQAHVRGHQARKKSFVWSVLIVEKVILRWRRKRGGLRIKPESSSEEHSAQEGTSTKDDDYNILKEGRKQTEGRVQKALARVKSMVQYPEARDQYRRLLTVAQEAKEIEGLGSRNPGNIEEPAHMGSDLIDLDMLLDDKTFTLE